MTTETLANPEMAVYASTLTRGLRRVRRRVRLLMAVRIVSTAAGLAAGFAVPLVVLAKLYDYWYPPLLPELTAAGAALVTLLIALFWPLPDSLIAENTDRRLGLRDRLSTAVELVRDPDPSGMEDAAVLDALDHLQGLRSSHAYPLRLYRSTKTAGLCLLVLLAVQLAPIPPWLLTQEQREERAMLRKRAAEIEPLARELSRAAEQSQDEEARQVARKLQQLTDKLKHGKLDTKQALLGLKELEKQLGDLEQRMGPPKPKTAERAAEALKAAERDRLAARADALAERAAKSGDKQVQKQLQELSEQAKRATNSHDIKRLSEDVEKQSQKLGSASRIPGNMPAAVSAALEAQDLQAALDALDAMISPLEEAEGKLSKEEAEELAKQLEALAEALKGTELEEMSDSLCESARLLKMGRCERAAECLGQGCKACRLAAGKAGARKACKACKGGLGKCRGACSGAGAGMGIGPDDGSQQQIPADAKAAGLYDPRATATDGDAERVRAFVRPDGQMLSVMEKSAPVVISGSKVPYYEVIGEYSKTAEEALEKENVPPTYRGTVRDYFDALQGAGKAAATGQPEEGDSD